MFVISVINNCVTTRKKFMGENKNMFVNHNDFAKVFYCVMSKIIFSKPLKIFTYVECQGFKLHLMYSLILEKTRC